MLILFFAKITRISDSETKETKNYSRRGRQFFPQFCYTHQLGGEKSACLKF